MRDSLGRATAPSTTISLLLFGRVIRVVIALAGRFGLELDAPARLLLQERGEPAAGIRADLFELGE